MIFDKNWRARFRLHRRANRHILTDLGKYELKYMIDKYLNEEDIDEIKAYEDKIKMIEDNPNYQHVYTTIFPKVLENEIEEKKRCHAFATFHYVCLLLYALKQEDKEIVLKMINEKNINDFMRLYTAFERHIEGD